MALTTLSLPTLYAEFSSDELGRTDLAYILYDKDRNDVTSIVTITSDAGYASGNQTLFPIHISHLPISYIPGYLHVYFANDLTIRPIDMDASLVNAIILSIRQSIATTPNESGFQDLIAQELGQSTNTNFIAFLANVWGLWKSLFSTYPYLIYAYAKRHAITYLMGQYWIKYDSKEKDITEFESQQFSNLIKLLKTAEDDILMWTNRMVGFVSPTAGELSAVFPIEFIGSLYSPNSILYRGYPSVFASNPLQPQI